MTRILIFNGFFCNSDSFKSYKLFIKNIVQFITIEEKTYIFSSSENKLLLKCSNNSKRNILKSLFSSWINYEMLGFERGGGLLLCVSGVSLHMYSIYWVDTLSNFLLEISWIWKREPKSNICMPKNGKFSEALSGIKARCTVCTVYSVKRITVHVD